MALPATDGLRNNGTLYRPIALEPTLEFVGVHTKTACPLWNAIALSINHKELLGCQRHGIGRHLLNDWLNICKKLLNVCLLMHNKMESIFSARCFSCELQGQVMTAFSCPNLHKFEQWMIQVCDSKPCFWIEAIITWVLGTGVGRMDNAQVLYDRTFAFVKTTEKGIAVRWLSKQVRNQCNGQVAHPFGQWSRCGNDSPIGATMFTPGRDFPNCGPQPNLPQRIEAFIGKLSICDLNNELGMIGMTITKKNTDQISQWFGWGQVWNRTIGSIVTLLRAKNFLFFVEWPFALLAKSLFGCHGPIIARVLPICNLWHMDGVQ